MPGVKAENNLIVASFWTKFALSSAQVLTAFSAPTTVVQGTPGKVLVPVRALLKKSTGTAYTIGAATNFQLQTTAGFALVDLVGPASVSAFFNSTSERSQLSFGPSFAENSFISSLLVDTHLGLGLRVKQLVADMTVGTATLECWLNYEEWPLSLAWF